MVIIVESLSLCFLQIYVVMEKMNGDMLEMILNNPAGKLTERITKFMTYQVSLICPQGIHLI